MSQSKTNQLNTSPKRERGIGLSGFSLLEVVLALAILGASVAILTQLMKIASDNAIEARALTTAQLLCESKMVEAISGIIPLQSTTGWSQITNTVAATPWYYQLQILSTEQQNMIGVEVQVTDSPNLPLSRSRLTTVRLVRWIIDPALQLDVLPEPTTTDQTASTSTSNGGTTSGGTP